MRELLIISTVGAGTYAMRAVFLTVGGAWRLGPGVRRRLHHARHAVLAALTVGFVTSGHAAPQVSGAALLAAGIAALTLRERALAPLVAGLGAAFLVAGF